jgi:hypothetical protein
MQARMPRRAACAETGGEAELAGVCERDRDDAILEAERRKADRIVLDVEIGRADALAEVLRAHERCKAYGQIRLKAFRDGQKPRVAPDIGWAGCNGLAGKLTARGVKVVLYFEGRQAVRTARERLVSVSSSTPIAGQFVRATGIIHRASISLREEEERCCD